MGIKTNWCEMASKPPPRFVFFTAVPSALLTGNPYSLQLYHGIPTPSTSVSSPLLLFFKLRRLNLHIPTIPASQPQPVLLWLSSGPWKVINVHFVVTHLDGRQLLVKSQRGEVVNPDQFKAISNEGMTMYQRQFMRIHFTVEFPDSLTPGQCKALEAVLPPKSTPQMTDMELDECEETTLHDVNMEEETRRKHRHAQQEAYDEDEENAWWCS